MYIPCSLLGCPPWVSSLSVWLTDYGLVAVLVSFKDVTGLLQLCQGVDDLSPWKLGEAANQFITVHAIYMVVGVVGS